MALGKYYEDDRIITEERDEDKNLKANFGYLVYEQDKQDIIHVLNEPIKINSNTSVECNLCLKTRYYYRKKVDIGHIYGKYNEHRFVSDGILVENYMIVFILTKVDGWMKVKMNMTDVIPRIIIAIYNKKVRNIFLSKYK